MTRDQIADINPDLVVMDGFDDCILGIGTRFGSEQFVIYDYDKVIAQLESYGMTYEEAVEYTNSTNSAPMWETTRQPL